MVSHSLDARTDITLSPREPDPTERFWRILALTRVSKDIFSAILFFLIITVF